MIQHYQTQVCIIGAGPVGLTLAMDLAQRGIQVIITEIRHKGEAPNVKCNHVSARSMEIFRRLGVAQMVRQTGLPDDYPNDVAYKTRFLGQELSRIRIPSRNARYSAIEGPDTGWPTAEPPHRINQIYLEPVLFQHAEKQQNIRILNRTEALDFSENSTSCEVQAIDLESQKQIKISADFIVGCDGGRSMVRKKMGTQLSGVGELGKVQSTCIRAPKLLSKLTQAPAWTTFSVNPERSGNVYAIDGKEIWLIHNYLNDHEHDFDAIDRNDSIRAILGVDEQFEYEVLSKEDWTARRLVADQFRKGRVFICGDAAHLWVPMAGYGMNAGIADAMNLSWTLAAYLNGWAGEEILDIYQIERQPITSQVSKFAMNHALALHKERQQIPSDIEDQTESGAVSRAAFGQVLYDLNVRQYCCSGLNFGYYYENSPVIAYDEESAPAYDMNAFVSSTVPGCRLPDFYLKNQDSLYDCLGAEYSLLCFGSDIDLQRIQQQATDMNFPLSILLLQQEQVPEGLGYKHAYILVRPDQHVAWRGNTLPENLEAFLNQFSAKQLPRSLAV
ncbi:FAD-dependent oxidoreductase [Acinetobacter sp. ANC 3813]|uniref:FAD-dependent oxidoreductase n=1 Tax=Acinetobacter sp. ANC 3813 TaxID=1977873 RepID=UPI000A330E84|nr:FAD-dependent oxidoreductase [Acinetobacter sp. ANC 3813]OTG90864.1 monooxygenase [Acinetobacter sp. ANC 3813]